MKALCVLSGKGGVGKSSIVASMAVALSKTRKIVCADCDVDASNLSILFSVDKTSYKEWGPVSTNELAKIDKDKCTGCMLCYHRCYFNAIEMQDGKAEVAEFGCEGCGVCKLVCPAGAVSMEKVYNAHIGYADTGRGFSVASAQLEPGGSGSGKIVFQVKRKAVEIAKDADIMIIDAAAGIGCPVIASTTGADYAVIVTEPTPSGYSDMKRAFEVVRHFSIPCALIMNKADLHAGFARKIEDFAKEEKIGLLSRIDYDKAFISALSAKRPIYEFDKRYQSTFDRVAAHTERQLFPGSVP